jgi:hypothetical protein
MIRSHTGKNHRTCESDWRFQTISQEFISWDQAHHLPTKHPSFIDEKPHGLNRNPMEFPQWIVTITFIHHNYTVYIICILSIYIISIGYLLDHNIYWILYIYSYIIYINKYVYYMYIV